MKKILFIIFCFLQVSLIAQTNIPSAQSIITNACKEAAKQNKKVFIIFHASWCGWCHKMDSSMNDVSCKSYFEKSFVIAHITVYERGDKEKLNNAGGEDILKKYHANTQGIPAWFILDKDEKLLADSQIRPTGASLDTEGKNVGCPAQKDEVEHFIKVLKQTTTLNAANENAIRTKFLKNSE
ncbi:MAG: thioredoxin family protein [Bacteroidetes bacterium]|nr:thioredoxin family protein [Bacteroidota bacterium]MBS1641932.1 thioredoxin family protein [Bacteroidota bacterium]